MTIRPGRLEMAEKLLNDVSYFKQGKITDKALKHVSPKGNIILISASTFLNNYESIKFLKFLLQKLKSRGLLGEMLSETTMFEASQHTALMIAIRRELPFLTTKLIQHMANEDVTNNDS